MVFCQLCDESSDKSFKPRAIESHIKLTHFAADMPTCKSFLRITMKMLVLMLLVLILGDQCGKHFLVPSLLRDHIKHVHEKVALVCDIEGCNEKFADQHQIKKLAAHKRIVHGIGAKVHTCEFCGKTFNMNFRLQYHKQEAHGEKDCFCDQCGKAFASVRHLKEHIVTHKEYTIECTVKDCGCKFPTQRKLAAHMKNCHKKKKEKTIECPECPKMFDQMAKMKHHVAVVHRGERPFKCDQCDHSFAYANARREHIETIHEGVMFTCQYCSKQMNRIANLNKHMVS